MTSAEISRKKSHAPRCRLEHDRRNDEQIDTPDSFHERAGEKRTDDAPKLAAHADEGEQAFTLIGAEYIRHERREGSVGDKRNQQCASEHPPEILDAVVRADVIAHWFDDVVAAEDQKIKNEAEPECANLVRLYINDLGEDAFHFKRAVILSVSEGPLLLA